MCNRFLLLSILFVILFVKVDFAQVCTGPGQTPGFANNVCTSSAFDQPSVPVCGSRQVPCPCRGAVFTDKNPYWYQFECFESGTLGFTITPNNMNDDYDWQLFDVTNKAPDDIYTDPSLFVACNWSGESGITGASSAGKSLMVCDNLGQPLFSSMPALIKGHQYLLLVSHFTDSQSGYKLSFTNGTGNGGTASITDPTPPHMKSVDISCDRKTIHIKLNKKMKCSSLTKTEFSISPALAAVVAVQGVGCINTFSLLDSVVITLDKPLLAGSYMINNDGNGLIDNCGTNLPVEGLALIVTPQAPALPDSVIKPGCAPTSLQLMFKDPVRCNSIAADGSDFIVTANGKTVQIIQATGNCNAAGLTTIVNLQLQSAIVKGGNYSVLLKKGSDNNTVLNECDVETPENITTDFLIKDTVFAGFTYTVTPTCKQDIINYASVRNTNPVLYNWIFDNSKGISADTAITYFTTGDKKATLIVSNGVCSDTSTASILLDPKVKASFEMTSFICPNEPVKIQNTSEGPIVSWIWDFGNGSISTQKDPSDPGYPQLSLREVATYTVSLIAKDAIGCTDTAFHQVKSAGSCYIAVPSAFTPNNDGINDYLYPLNAYKAIDLNFRVYNRLGQLVFETKDWTNKWNGRYKGQQQDAGTYVWILQYTDSETGKKFDLKGNTVLIR